MRQAGGLRILVVAPLPDPLVWGSGIRIYQLIRQLSVKHEVSLLTYAEADEADRVTALRSICEAVHTVKPPQPLGGSKRWSQFASLLSARSYEGQRLRSAAMQAAIDRLLADKLFDIVQVETSAMFGFNFGSHLAVLLVEHNIDYELLYRTYRQERSPARKLYNWVEYAKVQREERRCWERSAGVILTSAREEAIVRRYAPATPTATVPNGADIEYFRPTDTAPDPDRIVFTGLIGYRPNADGVIHFVRAILPRILRVRPNLTFTVVGAGVPDEVARLAGPNVVVTGWVPDVRPYVEQARVMVVPLRMGGGTRLKVLEGLAMGKPVVSTALGCEGIAVRDGEHLLVADDPPGFAGAVLRLLDDDGLATRLGRAGRTLVEREYGWASIAQRLEAFYREILRSGDAPNAGGNSSPTHDGVRA